MGLSKTASKAAGASGSRSKDTSNDGARARAIARRLGALTALGLATVVVLEVILRLAAPVYFTGIKAAYRYDPELGYRLKDGIHLLQTSDYQAEIRTNALGTVNFQESFKGYDKLIFAAGDSYTQGTGLPADAAYPFQLDLLLNRDGAGRYTKRFGVVNLGLAAFGGEQSLLAIQRYAKRLGEPALILYLGCDNDYNDDVLFRRGYQHRHMVEGHPRLGALVGPINWLAETQIGRRLRLAFNRRGRALGAQAAGTQPKESDSIAAKEAKVLERLRALARRYDARLVVSWASGGSSYRWMKKWARRSRVPFADWRPTVQAVKRRIPAVPLRNKHSGGHWRSWVNGLIAEAYAKHVEVRR